MWIKWKGDKGKRTAERMKGEPFIYYLNRLTGDFKMKIQLAKLLWIHQDKSVLHLYNKNLQQSFYNKSYLYKVRCRPRLSEDF